MIIHSQIREEILECLKQALPNEINWYNGRPSFIDIDEEQSAVAVFIDEANCTPVTACHEEWEAKLNIVLYQKALNDAETRLDKTAQNVVDVLQEVEFKNLSAMQLSGYTYDQDEQHSTWHIAIIQFEINYERTTGAD
ncbi:phage minor tail U family protein [Actinobacillus equuli subsp. haemolyticus]|nr:phage minor tail U family protein [Actinobacillus equuli subsp. haemolyticus]